MSPLASSHPPPSLSPWRGRRGLMVALLSLLPLQACQNHGPSLEPLGDLTLTVGVPLSLEIRATDPDGDSLIFGYESPLALTGASLEQLTPQAALFSWVPEESHIGTHQLLFSVSDGQERASMTVRLSVAPGEPSLHLEAPEALLVDPTLTPSVTVEIQALDEHSDVVFLSLDQAIGEGEELFLLQGPLSASYTWTPTPAQMEAGGVYRVTFRGEDDLGQEDHSGLEILLLPPRECPLSPPTLDLQDQVSGPGDIPAEVSLAAPTPVLAFYSLEGSPLEAPSSAQYLELTDPLGEETHLRAFIPHLTVPAGEILEVAVVACTLEEGQGGCFSCSSPSTMAVIGIGARRAGFCEPCTRDSDCLDSQGLCDPTLGACLTGCAQGEPCVAGSACQDREGRLLCVPLIDCGQVGGGLPCSPCTQNADCGSSGDLCLQDSLQGYLFCSRDCSDTGACGPAFECQDLGGGLHQCVPSTGSCEEMDRGSLCKPCQEHSDCGGLADLCITVSDEGTFCSQSCGNDSIFCPEGFACMDLGNDVFQCYPLTESCLSPPTRFPSTGDLLFNEILASLPEGEDLNGNDVAAPEGRDDQFLEIVNTSYLTLDLGTVALVRNQSALYDFPQETLLPPGEALLLFAGGDPSTFYDEQHFGGATVLSAGGILLDEEREYLSLTSGEVVITEVCYDRAAPQECFAPVSHMSLTRERDGDPDSAMVGHEDHPLSQGRTSSPGIRVDGQAF